MKRTLLVIALAVTSALAAHGIYSAACPEKSPEACTMEWLTRELRLSSAQADAIWEIHTRRRAEICRLEGERAFCAPETAPSVERACRFATEQLITEVSTRLTPRQRERYLEIVAPCRPPTGEER